MYDVTSVSIFIYIWQYFVFLFNNLIRKIMKYIKLGRYMIWYILFDFSSLLYNSRVVMTSYIVQEYFSSWSTSFIVGFLLNSFVLHFIYGIVSTCTRSIWFGWLIIYLISSWKLLFFNDFLMLNILWVIDIGVQSCSF